MGPYHNEKDLAITYYYIYTHLPLQYKPRGVCGVDRVNICNGRINSRHS